ncbi:MAG TPA: cation diffusion facilitator family transporter, partial [Gammaproteobacteria bacterium]|nr:cation diffusion facilitator family transporter [Gammaproteobacteria bacterium]
MNDDRHQQHYHFLPGQPSEAERSQATRRVTLVGAVVNLVLAAVKVVLGWLGQSQALIADGVHSLSDLVTDAMVWFASMHGSRAADESHPYGHARIETAATVGLGVILALVGGGILVDAIQRLFHTERLWMPGVLALAAAAGSVAVKEAVDHYTLRVARKYR